MIRAILLDIEGTTSPVAFVYEVLFPFARARLGAFLEERGNAEITRILQNLADEYENDPEARKLNLKSIRELETHQESVPVTRHSSPVTPLRNPVLYLEWLMDRDRKSTALKAIQGLIWKEGFENGELKGEVFEDVPPALKRWKENGLTVAIFSSGSVLAQRQYFAHSNSGDINGYIDANFDTETGPKREPESYRLIAKALGLNSDEILFISDVPEELAAAREAGFEVRLAIRPGNKIVADPSQFQSVSDFDRI